MSDYNKLLDLVNSETVQLGTQLPKVQLHKWLVLGQTEYVCKYGTLSDGHEKLTDSQRYAQSIKEMYTLSMAMRGQKSLAKRAQAKLLRAMDKLENAESPADILDAEADKEDAETQLASALVSVEDQMRMIKAYDAVRRELAPTVEAQYPHGIEQAELDNWKAVAEYRTIMEQTPGMQRQHMFNVPLPPMEKAKLGLTYGRNDMVAPLIVHDKEKILALTENGDVKAYLEHVEKEQKLLESK